MNIKLLLPLIILIMVSSITHAQPQLLKDFEGLMNIPEIIALESSPAHLYVLSDTEGLAVFRTSSDSLQWLYTSENMQRRGNTLISDIRYAYLIGNGTWLTVIDPTNVLGVYSSTRLPSIPIDVARNGDYLYVALQDDGLAQISLKTPESVEDSLSIVLPLKETRSRITSLQSRPGQLFVLTENSRMYYFEVDDDNLNLINDFNLRERVNRLYTFDDELLASNDQGEVFSIFPDGSLLKLFSVNAPVKKIQVWRDYMVILDENQRIWLQKGKESPELYREDEESNNVFTVSKNQLWMTEFEQLSRLYTVTDNYERDEKPTPVGPSLKIASIPDKVIPLPQPLLLTLGLESDHDISEIQFQYRSSISDAIISKQGLYWQPRNNDTGVHRFTVIASSNDGQVDSTSFTVNIRPFNAPPRFSPVRPITIAVDESFTLPVKANDPDGLDGDLIRYLGVDMPQGATLDENSGRFNWTPNRRQVGGHEFQIIATDQFGAAASLNISITVREINRVNE
ncbi:MAG: Ig domain-containing protein [Balneolales bacterium]